MTRTCFPDEHLLLVSFLRATSFPYLNSLLVIDDTGVSVIVTGLRISCTDGVMHASLNSFEMNAFLHNIQ